MLYAANLHKPGVTEASELGIMRDTRSVCFREVCCCACFEYGRARIFLFVPGTHTAYCEQSAPLPLLPASGCLERLFVAGCVQASTI